jgi:hypothetical protein
MSQLPERARKAGRALLELGGAAAPGDVGRRAGLDHNGQARALTDLDRAGRVIHTGGWGDPPPHGWDTLLERPRPDAGILDQALALWPYRHRAFLELLLSAVVARRHVDQQDPHLGFMAIGATGTGKSAMAGVACELLGLDPAEHTLLLAEQTEGSVLGRREPTPDGWRYSPTPAMALPLVFFDEFDKGDDAVRRATLPYFQGRLDVVREGQRFRYAPTPMLAANPPRSGDRYGQLRVEYQRRSVVLDSGDSRAVVAGLEEALTAFYDEPRRPWRGVLRLDELAPPAADFPEGLRRFLSTVVSLLTDAGAEVFCGARALELVTVGRAGLVGVDTEEGLVALAIATAHDYVACAESLPGLVQAGWHGQLEALREQVGPDVDLAALDAALVRRRAELDGVARQLRAARKAERAEDLAVVGARGELVAELRYAIADLDGRRVPPAHRVKAAGIRAQLAELRDPAGRATTHARVAELRELAAGPLAAAHELRRTIDAEKAWAEEAKRQQLEARKREREAQRRHPSARTADVHQKRQWEQALTAVRTSARELERLWRRKATRKGEHPIEVLRALVLPGGHPVVEYHAPPPQPRPAPDRTFGQRIRERLATRPAGRWHSTIDTAVSYTGASLTEWGSPSRALLEPAMAELYALEDRLAFQLGRKPRPGRPELARQSTRSNVVPMARPVREVLPQPWGGPYAG